MSHLSLRVEPPTRGRDLATVRNDVKLPHLCVGEFRLKHENPSDKLVGTGCLGGGTGVPDPTSPLGIEGHLGSVGASLRWTKTVRKLNNSVLNKMPRDCTAPNAHRCTVPLMSCGIPYYDMRVIRKKNKKSRQQKPRTDAPSLAKPQVTVAPANVNVRTIGSVPEVMSLKTKTIVKNREFIYDVPGSAAYGITLSLAIQPGSLVAFPWLCAIANSFEVYRFRRLQYQFVPNRGTSTGGSVWMAVDYDASDPAPASKVELAAFSHSVRGSIWSPLVLPCNPRDYAVVDKRFTSDAGVPAGKDDKLYNVGNLYVAVQGAPDTNSVGDLWVEYEVEFDTPQLNNPIASRSKQFTVTNTGTLAQPLKGATVSGVGNQTLDNASDDGGSWITFPAAGSYILDWLVNGTSITNTPLFTTAKGSLNVTPISSNVLASGATATLSAVVTVLAAGSILKATMSGRAAALAAQIATLAPYVLPAS